jgi:hypothetical protein
MIVKVQKDSFTSYNPPSSETLKFRLMRPHIHTLCAESFILLYRKWRNRKCWWKFRFGSNLFRKRYFLQYTLNMLLYYAEKMGKLSNKKVICPR